MNRFPAHGPTGEASPEIDLNAQSERRRHDAFPLGEVFAQGEVVAFADQVVSDHVTHLSHSRYLLIVPMCLGAVNIQVGYRPFTLLSSSVFVWSPRRPNGVLADRCLSSASFIGRPLHACAVFADACASRPQSWHGER